MSRYVAFVVGVCVGLVIAGASLEDREPCRCDDRTLDALARAFTENAVELGVMNERCVLVPPSQDLGVVKVRRVASGPGDR